MTARRHVPSWLVADRLRKQLAAGRWHRYDPIRCKAVAAEYKCAPSTAGKALQTLQAEGLVKFVGNGYVVMPPRLAKPKPPQDDCHYPRCWVQGKDFSYCDEGKNCVN